MAERREIVRSYVGQGLTVEQATRVAAMSKSTYYYRSKGSRKGKAPSRFTQYRDGYVSDQVVVEHIRNLLSDDFIDYGYKRTCMVLRREGYRINPKKVYRLMRDANLLFPSQQIRPQRKRTFVKYTVPEYERPFATLEMDIKYVHRKHPAKYIFPSCRSMPCFVRNKVNHEAHIGTNAAGHQ